MGRGCPWAGSVTAKVLCDCCETTMHNLSNILGASLYLFQRWRTQGHSHLIFTEALAFFMPLSSTEGKLFVHPMFTAAHLSYPSERVPRVSGQGHEAGLLTWGAGTRRYLPTAL